MDLRRQGIHTIHPYSEPEPRWIGCVRRYYRRARNRCSNQCYEDAERLFPYRWYVNRSSSCYVSLTVFPCLGEHAKKIEQELQQTQGST